MRGLTLLVALAAACGGASKPKPVELDMNAMPTPRQLAESDLDLLADAYVRVRGECPSIADLHAATNVDERDPWGTAYATRCTDDEFAVVSAGPDATFGTADDLRAEPIAPPAAPMARDTRWDPCPTFPPCPMDPDPRPRLR